MLSVSGLQSTFADRETPVPVSSARSLQICKIVTPDARQEERTCRSHLFPSLLGMDEGLCGPRLTYGRGPLYRRRHRWHPLQMETWRRVPPVKAASFDPSRVKGERDRIHDVWRDTARFGIIQ